MTATTMFLLAPNEPQARLNSLFELVPQPVHARIYRPIGATRVLANRFGKRPMLIWVRVIEGSDSRSTMAPRFTRVSSSIRSIFATSDTIHSVQWS
jgi:hypothetical protein